MYAPIIYVKSMPIFSWHDAIKLLPLCSTGALFLRALQNEHIGLQAEPHIPVEHPCEGTAAVAMGTLSQWNPALVRATGPWV